MGIAKAVLFLHCPNEVRELSCLLLFDTQGQLENGNLWHNVTCDFKHYTHVTRLPE